MVDEFASISQEIAFPTWTEVFSLALILIASRGIHSMRNCPPLSKHLIRVAWLEQKNKRYKLMTYVPILCVFRIIFDVNNSGALFLTRAY